MGNPEASCNCLSLVCLSVSHLLQAPQSQANSKPFFCIALGDAVSGDRIDRADAEAGGWGEGQTALVETPAPAGGEPARTECGGCSMIIWYGGADGE